MFINENNLKELPQADVIPPSLELDSAASVRGDNFIMEEIWKPVTECPNYEVSNNKIVRSLLPCKKGKEPYTLKVFISKTGYYVVNLWINGNRRTRKLHRLYAIEFITNPLNLPEVNHLNGDKLCIEDWNLEWCTGLRNKQHAFETGLIPKVLGQDQSSTKLTDNSVLEIAKSKKSCSVLATQYGVSVSAIASIKTGKSWGWLTGIKYSKSRERVKFSPDTILSVFNSDEEWVKIKEKYDISISHIGFIKSGRVYSELTGKKYVPAHRLNSAQINEIKSSTETNISLSIKFNVHKDTIRNIKKDAYNYKSRN